MNEKIEKIMDKYGLWESYMEDRQAKPEYRLTFNGAALLMTVRELSQLLTPQSVDVEKIKEEFSKQYDWLINKYLSKDGNLFEGLWDFFLPYLQPQTPSVRNDVIDECAKIVEEMMEDSEHWKPIADRILTLKSNELGGKETR